MRFVLLALLLACFVQPVHAADVDLSISAGDITFSKSPLVAGDKVRMYAEIKNVGEEDVSGYVSFFQGSTPIGDSQVISVRAHGTPEEVYVDFTVPSGPFNMRAEIRGTDPVDAQPSNNVAITKLYTPIMDDDRDGVANESDNCPASKNANQADADKDGQGDTCDADDDNDGLSDDVEKEIGTDRTKKDTDGDGVNDPDDAYPLDSTKTKEAPPAPVVVPKPTPTPAPKPTPTPAVSSKPAEQQKEEVGSSVTPSEEAPLPEEVSLVEPERTRDVAYAGTTSLGAVFAYTRLNWNTFGFDLLIPLRSGERLEWNFGDGVTSGQERVQHTFAASGSYTVTVRRIAQDGTVSEDSAEVTVPFFTLHNRLILAMTGVLILALLAGGLAAFRLRTGRREEDDF